MIKYLFAIMTSVLNIRRGNLRQNFSPTNIENKDKKSIVFFNPTPYGGIHDRGNPQKHIPQREFMWLSDNAMTVMAQIIVDRIWR